MWFVSLDSEALSLAFSSIFQENGISVDWANIELMNFMMLYFAWKLMFDGNLMSSKKYVSAFLSVFIIILIWYTRNSISDLLFQVQLVVENIISMFFIVLCTGDEDNEWRLLGT